MRNAKQASRASVRFLGFADRLQVGSRLFNSKDRVSGILRHSTQPKGLRTEALELEYGTAHAFALHHGPNLA